MIDKEIVYGCKEMAVPVWFGYDTVYVHTDIHPDLTPDPVTGEINPDMYSYHEIQYRYPEYIEIMHKRQAATENAICDNDRIYAAEMANIENALCEQDERGNG